MTSYRISNTHCAFTDRDISVGIATCYGLDGPGSNPGGGEIFRTQPDRPWGPLSLPYNGYLVLPGGKTAGAWRWTPSSAEIKERIELYLCFPLRAFVACSRVTFTFTCIFTECTKRLRFELNGSSEGVCAVHCDPSVRRCVFLSPLKVRRAWLVESFGLFWELAA